MSSPAANPSFALAELERRIDVARKHLSHLPQGMKRDAEVDRINRELAPWLAAAIRAGADFPRIEPDHWADLVAQRETLPDGLARAVVADRIAPLAAIRAELTRARRVAIGRLARADADEATHRRAGDMAALAAWFGCTEVVELTRQAA